MIMAALSPSAVMWARCLRTAERIDVLFGVETPESQSAMAMRPSRNYFGHLIVLSEA